MTIAEIVILALKGAMELAALLAKAFGYSTDELKAEFKRQMAEPSAAQKAWDAWQADKKADDLPSSDR